MSNYINRIKNKVTQITLLGGGMLIAYSFLEEYISPFFPLFIFAMGGLIAGSFVRLFFIFLFNRRVFSNYRVKRNSQTRQTENINTKSYQNKINNTHDNSANTVKFETSDSLMLYRNLLGLKPVFSAEELKIAYRSAAAMYHPDRYANASAHERKNAEDLMKKVNEAYERLKAV